MSASATNNFGSASRSDALRAEATSLLQADNNSLLLKFAAQYFKSISNADIDGFTATQLAATLRNMWYAAQTRDNGAPIVRAYTPATAPYTWHGHSAVLDVVQDDMPFLVDSLAEALHRFGLNVQLSIHPIFSVTRDSSGTVTEINTEGGQNESWMQVFFDPCAPNLLHDIENTVQSVLEDVKNAVADWRPMRKAMEDAKTQLANGRALDGIDRNEAQEFLSWLDNDHFTYLGSRDYKASGSGDDLSLKLVDSSGLGILRNDDTVIFEGLRSIENQPPEVCRFMSENRAILVTKTNVKATVHRGVAMDAIFIKLFDDNGNVIGERLMVGLLTSLAYSRNARDIPLIRQKVANVVARSGLNPTSHDGKALVHILDTYPRDELFQIEEDDLYAITLGVTQLQERRRVALFVRNDPFGRYVSCLVYVPRETYDTDIRTRITQTLEHAFGGTVANFTLLLDQNPLARLHLIIRTAQGTEMPDLAATEDKLAQLARSWSDRLRDELTRSFGEIEGLEKLRTYGNAFGLGYRTKVMPEEAISDITMLDWVANNRQLGVRVYAAEDENGKSYGSLKLYHIGDSIKLSSTLPMIENMGFKVDTEFGPYQITLNDGTTVWMHDYRTQLTLKAADVRAAAHLVEETFRRTWLGDVENDRFNRLTMIAHLDWRATNILRMLAKYMRQIRIPFSADTMADTLAAHPEAAKLICRISAVKFDPDFVGDRTAKIEKLTEMLKNYIREIPNLDEDRILSTYLNIINAAVRTNYYQTQEDGSPKPYVSVKFLSSQIEAMPLPKPYAEIFVYSPRTEAVHLRGGKVARGGIRWSDRLEDFRTEVLGLMKAQMVKNAVIVPVGSKGGFVVKQPTDNMAAEGIACYRIMMAGLLDITDNYVLGGIVPPVRVVRHDGDDPYLVVAADKGTAKFSDIANEISISYGFWLGDAFASGGSAGYDHKQMGITARGAWEAVMRHFRELGVDTQTQAFTCIGVGDMAGDVFGNGLLRSEHTQLIAAFNYAHIFIDPNPDAALSYQERSRLFDIARGSWDQYDTSKISAGGGVWPRSVKSIPITAEMKARFGFTADAMSPDELIQALLTAQVDLLYFGGIGTYIKTSSETHMDVGDKSNDNLRVNGEDIRARVIGEGANLGITQRGRIAMAARGVKLNTDAIDNSAGVDTSDHEVNIKILMADVIQQTGMTTEARDKLLESMTDDIAAHVLRDNYLQTQVLTMSEARAAELLPAHRLLMHRLESIGLLNRAIEYLPDDVELARRETAKLGLTRPELAVLLAYTKIWLYDQLVKTPLMADSALEGDLLAYFPPALAATYRDAITKHRLAREIVATVITNEIINRLGIHAIPALMSTFGVGAEAAARAYLIARDAFNLPALWQEVEALDNKVPAKSQTIMLLAAARSLKQAMSALLARPESLADIKAERLLQQNARDSIVLWLRDNATLLGDETEILPMAESRLPETLASALRMLGWLALLPRLSFIARETGRDLTSVIPTFIAIDERLQLRRLSRQLTQVSADTPWQAQALSVLSDDMLLVEQKLTASLVAAGSNDLPAWLASEGHDLSRYDELVRTARSQPVPDFALWSLISRELLRLVG